MKVWILVDGNSRARQGVKVGVLQEAPFSFCEKTFHGI